MDRTTAVERLARLRARGAGDPALVARERPHGWAVASYAQEQQWFLDKLSPDNAAYLVPFALRLRGPLDVAALREALARIVDRHAVLRTRFRTVDGELRQLVAPALAVPVPVELMPGDTPADREAAYRRRAHELVTERFELTTGPLLRTTLLSLDPEDNVLVWVAHHAVADGFSVAVLVDELGALYRAALHAGPPPPPPALQYADVAEWERDRLTEQRLTQLTGYWREHLAGAPPATVPTDRPRPAGPSFRGEAVWFEFPAAVATGIADLGARTGTTPFMIMLAALQVVLARYTGEYDAVLGASVSGRPHPAVEPLIGPFSGTVALRVDATGDPTFAGLLARVRDVALNGLAHQEIPFGHLVRALGGARDASRNPLYQVLLTMGALREAGAPVAVTPDLTVQATGVHNGTSRLDLQLTVDRCGHTLAGRLDYNPDLYERATAERLVDQLRVVLAEVAGDPDRPLSHLSLLDPAERARLLERWHTVEPAPVLGFLARFAEQVRTGPDRVAVSHGSGTLTYRQLDEWSNRIAHAVLAAGGGPGRVVAVGVDRDLALLPVLLGVVKSGSAYLPLDPAFPAGRLRFMLHDSGARLLIGPPVPGGPPTLDVHDEAVTTAPGGPVDVAEDLSRPAYVMYTSGSTGRPKGVAVGHRALGNFLGAMLGLGLMRRDDVVIALTNLTFDISVDELFLPLSTGARVVVATRSEARDGARLVRLAADHRVSVLHGTPATCRLMVDAGWRPGGTIRRVLCGGEAMPARLAADLRDRAPEVWNLYGPTEATVWSLAHRVTGAGVPPIGRPLANTTALALDGSLRPVPPGVLGELYLGGAGLADGYLNLPELTAERFVVDGRGNRLYRTGDVVSYRADGVFEFHGRMDHQVKVRGHRIELGEVETALLAQPAVAEAAVLVREFGPDDSRLVAFVRTVEPVGEAQLRDAVGTVLPAHMVPSHVVDLDEFPLTPSGKVDRSALAERPVRDAVQDRPYEPPRTPTERLLARQWEELLGRDRVGVHDNLFVIGGHSLLAVRLLAAVEDIYGVELTLERFFAAPTVAGLAALVADAAPVDDDADELLRQIEELSDEDVARLLGR